MSQKRFITGEDYQGGKDCLFPEIILSCRLSYAKTSKKAVFYPKMTEGDAVFMISRVDFICFCHNFAMLLLSCG